MLDEIIFTPNAGVSMPVGDASDRYNLGICLGLDGLYPYNDHFQFGGRLAFDRWGIDGGGWTGSDVDGSSSIIEIIPEMKYLFNPGTTGGVEVFGLAGLGLYRFAYDVDVTSQGTTKTYDDSELKFGLSVGGGVTIYQTASTVWEVRPTFHVIFTEDTSVKYLSVIAGFSF